MKASWWKYVLLALLTAGVVACGKDNKTETGINQATSGLGSAGINNPVSTNTYAEFRNQVIAGNFQALANGIVYVVYSGYNTSYQWKDSWPVDYCKESSGSMKERTYNQGNYTHEYGTTAAAIHAGINAIVNTPQYYQPISGTSWLIRSGNFEYVIDTSRPLFANPVSKRAIATESTCTGSGYAMNINPAISY